MNPTSTYINYTMSVCTHTHAYTHTHCQEHIVQRDEGELTSSDTSLLSALYPLPQTPEIKGKEKKQTTKNPSNEEVPVYEVLSQLQNQAMDVAVANAHR
uniref:Uncharacterized protein n=1 Tax=Rhipicephalus appendiculatus TaxID=34631 RepID=A0A131YF65_RHIAP